MPWFSAVAKAAGRRIRAQSGLRGRGSKCAARARDGRQREPDRPASDATGTVSRALTLTAWATKRSTRPAPRLRAPDRKRHAICRGPTGKDYYAVNDALKETEQFAGR